MMFRLGADSTPLRRELDRLAPHFEEAGKKVGNKFKLGIASGMAAAVIGVAMTISRAIGEAIGDAVRDSRNASKFGVLVEEMQLIQQHADLTGASVENIVKQLRLGGVAAAELRKQMGVDRKSEGGGTSDGANRSLSFLGGVGRTAWNNGKAIAGSVAGLFTEAANVAVHGVTGFYKGIGTALRTGSISAGYETYTDSIAQGMAGSHTFATRENMRHMRQNFAQKKLEEAEEAARKKPKVERMPLIKAPEGQVDALTRVGIGTVATGADIRAFQEKSLKYLQDISRNTAKSADPMAGVET